ncbi:uncharacterized protein BDV17DRAFT_289874 [Aspergillus undulatus]|uniref:uncharacterized protein n=1 Tax=Aspergillus undulatus TaxID=1810928 RepID=UPI003CCE1880
MAVMSTMMSSRASPADLACKIVLNDLPPEIIHSIASYLSRDDLMSLRWASRYTYNATFNRFVQTFYRTLRTDFSADSLYMLDRLSSDRRVAPHVKSMRLGRKGPNNIGSRVYWPRSSPFRQLHLSGEGAMHVRWILRRLENCTSFEFHQPQGPMRKRQDDLLTADTVSLVLQTLVILNRPIHSFSVNLQCPIYDDSRINLRALCTLPEQPNLPTITATTRKLSFNFTIRCEHLVSNIFDMVHHSPQLEDLELICESGKSSAALLRLVLDAKCSFKLKHLILVGPNSIWVRPSAATIEAESLRTYLKRHRETLQTIKLKEIKLTDHEDWEGIIQDLGTGYSRLKQLHLTRLHVTDDDGGLGSLRLRLPNWRSLLLDGEVRFYRDTVWSNTRLRRGYGEFANAVFYAGPHMDFVCGNLETWPVGEPEW